MTASILLFILVVLIYIILVDVFTIFFRITGMPEEKARFQVISLLTNSGYSTKESEMVVSSKIRRKLAKVTMIFGYAFSATIISTIVSVFLSISDSSSSFNNRSLKAIAICVALFLVFLIIRKVTYIKTKFDILIQRLGVKLFYKSNVNHIIEIEHYGNHMMANVILNIIPINLKDITLSQSNIKKEHDINIILIKEKDGTISYPKPSTYLEQGTIVMLLGTLKDIKNVFDVSPSTI